MGASREEEFERYVRRRRGPLLRSATLLTAGDTYLAEDLVQTTLVRLYLAWPRARRTDLDAYARRALVNNLIDEKRRPFTRRERLVERLPDDIEPAKTDVPDAVLTALAELPPGMRAVIVLRHVEGLSVEETAAAIGTSPGSVKSQTARGLDKLRAALNPSKTELGDSRARAD
ncbi:MAG TPA: SigE family RNA polymerase sigma factor [Jatrophihabitans sp.]|nr:SigE family RNA polymerase sigma factor [Jatrophihabitans sp.]